MHSLLVPASPSRDHTAVAGWIAAAVGRREKVVYKHAPTEDAAAVLGWSLPAAGVDPGVLGSGQVQLADTAELHAETGGRHAALYALHLQQLEQATRDGFAGLALTGDAAAMRTVTRDEAELVGYERELERLAVESGVRSLCRYSLDAHRGLLEAMLVEHYRDVADDMWSVRVADGRLRVRGELEFSNADRFAPVLRAALAAGVRAVDVSELEFCDVAGVRALISGTDVLPRTALPLMVLDADGTLARVLRLTGALDTGVLRVTERDPHA
jgi:anti-anti-sigma factor